MEKTFRFILGIILLPNLLSAVASGIVPEEIVFRLQEREALCFKNIRGVFHLSAQYPMSRPDGDRVEFEKRYEWVKKGDMQKVTDEYVTVPESFAQPQHWNDPNRGTRQVIINTEKIILAFDGKNTKQYMSAFKQGTISPGSESFFMTMSPAHWLTPILREKYLSDFLNKEDVHLRYAGEVNLEGYKCHLLEFSSKEENGSLYLIEEKGWAPKKLVLNSNYNTLSFKTRVEYLFEDFKEFGNIILPMKVSRNMWAVYPDREECDINEILTVTHIDVNPIISDADMFIEFPVGTRVYDAEKEKTYVVDPNGNQAN